jgi:hypothetical protein
MTDICARTRCRWRASQFEASVPVSTGTRRSLHRRWGAEAAAVGACHVFRVMPAMPGSVSLLEVRKVLGDMANRGGDCGAHRETRRRWFAFRPRRLPGSYRIGLWSWGSDGPRSKRPRAALSVRVSRLSVTRHVAFERVCCELGERGADQPARDDVAREVDPGVHARVSDEGGESAQRARRQTVHVARRPTPATGGGSRRPRRAAPWRARARASASARLPRRGRRRPARRPEASGRAPAAARRGRRRGSPRVIL